MTDPAPEGRKITVDDPASPRGAGSDAGDRQATTEPDAADPAPMDGEDELDRVLTERDEYVDALQRLKAEFENYRKRAERDRGAAATAATRDMVAQFLPVMDNLERAVEALDGYGEEAVAGVEMVRGQLAAVFAHAGIEPIYVASGDEFDPAVHEAVARQPSGDHAEGAVTEVIQKGYRDAGGIVRPARVVVAAPLGGSE